VPDDDATTLRPAWKQASDATRGEIDSGEGDAEALPAAIGRYRILRLLGEGGMGAVYEAEQELPHRMVALKVIRAGYANSEMLRRFENEAQALGRLHHPGIAQIHDAGTADTPHGCQPYIAAPIIPEPSRG
jgi:eukaryotic-like serine/threonine-protein kinase